MSDEERQYYIDLLDLEEDDPRINDLPSTGEIDRRTKAIKLNPDGSCPNCEDWCQQGLMCNCRCFTERTGEKF